MFKFHFMLGSEIGKVRKKPPWSLAVNYCPCCRQHFHGDTAVMPHHCESNSTA